jgi:polyketide cyclase/dehydrase/lipid transport protein
MPHGTVSQIILAPSAAVFALLHDYSRRLEWDTLLSAAYLDDGFTVAAKGATSVCVGRWFLGRIALKTEYITFDPPRMAAVKMINRPPFFESWAASIHHEDVDNHSSRVTYTWTFTARPRWLGWLLEPAMNAMFRRETGKRLQALARHFSKRQS